MKNIKDKFTKKASLKIKTKQNWYTYIVVDETIYHHETKHNKLTQIYQDKEICMKDVTCVETRRFKSISVSTLQVVRVYKENNQTQVLHNSATAVS